MRSIAGAIKGIIKYAPSETWSLANVVTLAGLENAIPIPLAIKDKLRKQSVEDSEAASLTFQTDKDVATPQYTPKLVHIDEAPPRQVFHDGKVDDDMLPWSLLVKL